MRVELLGPVRALAGGQPLPLGAPRLQAVLGVLATRRDSVVSRGELVDALWGDHPPNSAENAVHVYISRLRRILEPDRAHRLLASVGSGYVLRLESGQLDVETFAAHRDRAHRLRANDDLPGAASSLDAALGLWRGTPWSGVPGPFAETERTRLNELWLAAVEERADVLLGLGRHAELAAELPGLVRAHPLREHLRGLLMRTLYRGGRQAEALAVFSEIRQFLVTELGVEPGLELRGLHQRVLANDPTLDPVAAPVPRQLPAPPRLFTGRARELIALSKAAAEAGSTLVISAIGGTGGMGKTWLAVHWAQQNLERFPDGQLQVNLRGFDPTGEPMSPAVALRGFLGALGVEPAAIPVDLNAAAALYRSLVAGKRMLVVLDNARDSAQVIPLLPGSPGCTVLVTSRSRLSALVTGHGAATLDLDVLEETEARDLLVAHVGHARINAEPAAVAELLDCCAGLPLALGIVGARAANHPDFPLAVLADELRDARYRLTALDTGELTANLRAVFDCSYRALDAAAATVFALLGFAAGPDISLPAAASLTALPDASTRAVLRELEAAHLVRQHAPGRYRTHDLIRLYAVERAARDIPEGDRRAALRRLVDFYLHTAYAADRLLAPHRQPIELSPAAAGCVRHPVPDTAAAVFWFTAEYPCLLAAQQLAEREGWPATVWQLAYTFFSFLQRQGLLHEHVAAWRAALAAATDLGDRTRQAVARRWLGHAYHRAGDYDNARAHLRHALTLAEQADDAPSRADAHFTLGMMYDHQGDRRRALSHAARALRVFQTLDNPVWEAMARNALGWCHARLGRYDDARGQCERALALYREHQDRNGASDTLDSLGYIAHQTGRHTDALSHYLDALAIYREIGNAYGEASTQERIGATHHALGQQDEARRAWLRSLDLYRAQHRVDEARRVQRRLDGADDLSGVAGS